MRCYLLMADGEWEEQIALELRRKMKEFYGKSKILFLSFRHPGIFAQKGFAEISKGWPRGSWRGWLVLCRDLMKRRNFRERRVFIGRNLFLLALVTLFGGRKVTMVVLSLGLCPFPVSFFHLLLLRYLARTVLVDDASLAQLLRQKNIPAYFIGNILADLLHPTETTFLHGRKPICALLPRGENFTKDLMFFLELSESISEHTFYLLLGIPKNIPLKMVQKIALEKGWVFWESFEGEVIEGYLVRGKTYLNLTRFLSEALAQAEYVVSAEPVLLVQAIGLGKTIVPAQTGKVEETLALLFHSVSLFEYNQAMGARFGKKGAIERIASFLLWGIVEDSTLLQQLHLQRKG